jgi:hypothetical protein
MNRTLLVLALAATAATPALPASAAAPNVGNDIVYPVTANDGLGVAGSCTFVADRWTADYGPTRLYAAVTAPNGTWTRIHCWIVKNGTTYVDVDRSADSDTVVVNETHGTIPVAGIQVCIEVEARNRVDGHWYAKPPCRNA